jgi:UPF0755 protein
MEGQYGKTPKPKKKKKNKKSRLTFWLLVVILCLAVMIVCFKISNNYVMRNYIEASQNKSITIDDKDKVEFIIQKGANTSKIAKALYEKGLIKNEKVFKLLSKINGFDGTYKSGTHYVSVKLSYDEMMRVLSSPAETAKVTIPEGRTFSQIVDLLLAKGIIKDKEKFIQVANTGDFDYDFIKDIPERENRLEGYLFPDTYEFDLNASEDTIINKMLSNFNNKFKTNYREKITKLGDDMTLDKIVIIASMIERESKEADDRYLVSGVIYNRLRSKDASLKKLQVDATVQYALLRKTGAYKEKLLYEDLEIDDPYNTYLNEGLPPGPICCPGEAAIKAALSPDTENGYLYYVATGDEEGTHAFAKTFAQHQANKKKYSSK